MDNLINIINTKANTLEFEMTIEGANASNVECHFVIAAKKMDLRFKAKVKDKKNNLWNVTIPAMEFLEKTTYKCFTEVMTDGQYFVPMSGNVNVVGSAEIYSSNPKNKTIESTIEKVKTAKKEDKKREEKRKNESWRQGEKSIEQIAKELMAAKKKEEDSPPAAKEPIVEDKKKTLTLKKKKIVEKKEPQKPVEAKSDDKKNEVKPIIESAVKKRVTRSKPVVDETKANEELVKAMIQEKEEEHRKAAALKEKEQEDKQAAKARAILEESGIKVKEKKKKVSFVKTVKTRLLN